jgi:hypothetical protein
MQQRYLNEGLGYAEGVDPVRRRALGCLQQQTEHPVAVRRERLGQHAGVTGEVLAHGVPHRAVRTVQIGTQGQAPPLTVRQMGCRDRHHVV